MQRMFAALIKDEMCFTYETFLEAKMEGTYMMFLLMMPILNPSTFAAVNGKALSHIHRF